MCSVCDEFGKQENCPCCTHEPVMVLCGECNGTGYTYYDEDGDIVSETIYNRLSEESRDFEICEYCGGDGKIEVEPDYN